MGYAFRDRRYRHVRWVRKDAPDELQAEELYDYEADPPETRNLLREPAASDALKRLRQCATIFLEGSPASR
jgi:hypothetical protein